MGDEAVPIGANRSGVQKTEWPAASVVRTHQKFQITARLSPASLAEHGRRQELRQGAK